LADTIVQEGRVLGSLSLGVFKMLLLFNIIGGTLTFWASLRMFAQMFMNKLVGKDNNGSVLVSLGGVIMPCSWISMGIACRVAFLNQQHPPTGDQEVGSMVNAILTFSIMGWFVNLLVTFWLDYIKNKPNRVAPSELTSIKSKQIVNKTNTREKTGGKYKFRESEAAKLKEPPKAPKALKTARNPEEKEKLFNRLRQETAQCHENEGDNGTYEALLKTKNKVDSSHFAALTKADQQAYDDAVYELEISGDLRKLKQLVLNLNQSTVAELKGYSNPPEEVLPIMGAAYILLGAKFKEVDTWEEVQILLSKLGKESLMRRVKAFRVHQVTDAQAKKATAMIMKVEESDEVEDTCGKACAAFYAWARGVLAERTKIQEHENN